MLKIVSIVHMYKTKCIFFKSGAVAKVKFSVTNSIELFQLLVSYKEYYIPRSHANPRRYEAFIESPESFIFKSLNKAISSASVNMC